MSDLSDAFSRTPTRENAAYWFAQTAWTCTAHFYLGRMIDESESEHRSEPEHQRSRWKNFAYRVAEEMAIAAATVTTTAIVEYVIEVIR